MKTYAFGAFQDNQMANIKFAAFFTVACAQHLNYFAFFLLFSKSSLKWIASLFVFTKNERMNRRCHRNPFHCIPLRHCVFFLWISNGFSPAFRGPLCCECWFVCADVERKSLGLIKDAKVHLALIWLDCWR